MQTDAEYSAYKARASFFNATSRTADGFVGLIFRRAPFVRLPDVKTGVGLALQRFENDVDLSGTNLGSYAQQMVRELIEVGRAGTLVDWEGGTENRAYVSLYAAEDILSPGDTVRPVEPTPGLAAGALLGPITPPKKR